MIAKTIQIASIAALCLLLGLLWRAGTETLVMFVSFVVWSGAMVVLMNALSSRKYWWGIGFAAIAIAFNPAVPVSLSRQASVALYAACIAAVCRLPRPGQDATKAVHCVSNRSHS